MKVYINPICEILPVLGEQEILYSSSAASADPRNPTSKPIAGPLSAPLRSVPSLRKI